MRTKFFYALAPAIVLLFSASVIANDGAKDDLKNKETQKPKVDRKTEKRLSRIWKTQEAVEGFSPVELFAAMDSGEIEVKIKMKSAADANVMVKNTTDKPLAIEMPPAFASVPVLPQLGFGGGGGGRGGGGFGGGGGNRGGGGFGGGGGQNQGGGGGFGGGGRGGGGFGGGGAGGGGRGGGGGIFNIPPGRTGKVSIHTFCLEHGKKDPEPRMQYEIKPLSALSTDPKVFEICQMLANDEVTQPVAQAAGWHVANDLSWEYMLNKNRVELSTGYFERYFTPGQLEAAYHVVDVAKQRAELRAVAKKEEKKSNEKFDYEEYSKGPAR